MIDRRCVVAFSTITDGSMSVGVSDDQRLTNRTRFLQRYDIDAAQTILVKLTYDGDDFRRFFTVTSDFAGDGITGISTLTADALYTKEKNLALLLPVADCIGAVFYDPVNEVIGLSHLGRHNLEQEGAAESVAYMIREFGTDPVVLQIWLSPSVGRATYPLHAFENRSLNEVALEQFYSVGVQTQNIEIDLRDTARQTNLFSHSEFLKGSREVDGRQAVIVMMRP